MHDHTGMGGGDGGPGGGIGGEQDPKLRREIRHKYRDLLQEGEGNTLGCFQAA